MRKNMPKAWANLKLVEFSENAEDALEITLERRAERHAD